MEKTTVPDERLRARRRRSVAAAAVLVALLASGAYGYLMRDDHLFPYRFLKHGEKRLRPAGGHNPALLHGRHLHLASDAIDRLMNLPYLRGYKPATESSGVRVHDRSLSQDGLNFFTSTHAPVATLMDMDGTVVKTWRADMAKAFPATLHEKKHSEHEKFLRDAELLPDGGVVAMFDQVGLVRLDADSRMLWAWAGTVHHDLFIGKAGNIWTLAHQKRVVPELRNTPVLEDFVVELSPEGKALREISLVQCFLRSRYAAFLGKLWDKAGEDIFHTNSVAVLDGSLVGRHPAFARGNLIVSIRNLNVVAVVDPVEKKVVWALTGVWRGQHCARLILPGHILVFDNFGTMQTASRALEVDPFTQQILWSYGGRADQELFSETVGYVDRLRNGNTLITESNYGRALEVAPDGRVAWEFVNPNRAGHDNKFIAVLHFMKRVDPDLPFLKSPAAGSLSVSPASPPRGAR